MIHSTVPNPSALRPGSTLGGIESSGTARLQLVPLVFKTKDQALWGYTA